MKKNTLFLTLLFASFATNAQTNITNYNWTSGIHRYFYTENSVNPNPVTPGNNVTWDFTSLTSDPADSSTFQISGSTPFSTDFPTANIVWSEYRKLEDRTILWHFYKDQFSFEFLGYGEVGVGSNVYSSQKKMLKFPFVFDSTFTDYYTAGSSYKSVVKYDGYGTLKLPGGTYKNVFRTTSKDSASPSNIVYFYEWFDANRRIMFMEVGPGYTYTYYLKTANTSDVQSVQKDLDVLIYPNPSAGTFKIELPVGAGQNTIKVFDIAGQLILQDQGKDSYRNLAISKPGYYLIEIDLNGQICYKKLVITN